MNNASEEKFKILRILRDKRSPGRYTLSLNNKVKTEEKNEEVFYLGNHKLLYIEALLLQTPRHQVPQQVVLAKPAEGQVVAGLSLGQGVGQGLMLGPHQTNLQSVLGAVGPCLPLSTLQELVGCPCSPTLLGSTVKTRENSVRRIYYD